MFAALIGIGSSVPLADIALLQTLFYKTGTDWIGRSHEDHRYGAADLQHDP